MTSPHRYPPQTVRSLRTLHGARNRNCRLLLGVARSLRRENHEHGRSCRGHGPWCWVKRGVSPSEHEMDLRAAPELIELLPMKGKVLTRDALTVRDGYVNRWWPMVATTS